MMQLFFIAFLVSLNVRSVDISASMLIKGGPLAGVAVSFSSVELKSWAFQSLPLQMPLRWYLSGLEHRSNKECFMLWRFRPSHWREQRRQAFPLGCTWRLTCSHLTDLVPLWWQHNFSEMYTPGIFLNTFINRIMD